MTVVFSLCGVLEVHDVYYYVVATNSDLMWPGGIIAIGVATGVIGVVIGCCSVRRCREQRKDTGALDTGRVICQVDTVGRDVYLAMFADAPDEHVVVKRVGAEELSLVLPTRSRRSIDPIQS